MNYKEILDKLDYLESKLSYLELENRHLKERVTKLEGDVGWFKQPMGPQFTPGTQPYVWPNTVTCSTNQQDVF